MACELRGDNEPTSLENRAGDQRISTPTDKNVLGADPRWFIHRFTVQDCSTVSMPGKPLFSSEGQFYYGL